ncbi:MAG: lysophospholipid acyltransferase family protein [Bacteriovorax sp.]|nr:lysophospholipid acyltransferase family protein [Bacteriovorax sp.]
MQIKILAQLIYFFVRILNFTYRYEFVGLDHKKKAKDTLPNKTFVYALWHQNLVGSIFSHIGERFTMVISESKDGELVAVTCEKFGHIPSRGSSTRGGKKALIEIVKTVKSGVPGALSVDGPKGPAKIVKPGVIEIARLADCPILPLSPYAKSFWFFEKSWDQFRVPMPFTKIVVVIGEPIYIDKTLDRDQYEDIAHKVGDAINKGEEVAKSILFKS